jgi:type IV secretory pathway VirB2 component (pilin)
MKPINIIIHRSSLRVHSSVFVITLLSILWAPALYAQASPWEQAVNLLQTSFTGPLARGLSLVAIVIGGIMFAYSEGGSKRTFAGIIFGLGMALGAVNFMSWLFGVA